MRGLYSIHQILNLNQKWLILFRNLAKTIKMADMRGQNISRANTPMKPLAEDISLNMDLTRLRKLAMEADQKTKSRILCYCSKYYKFSCCYAVPSNLKVKLARAYPRPSKGLFALASINMK